MKRKIFAALIAAAALVCATAATGCDGTAEVQYSLADGGSSYVVSGVKGNKYKLTEFTAPAVYDDGVHGELPVTAIGNSAFYMCGSLREVTLTDSVTEIGSLAFALCAFSAFTIPESVTVIGDGAFGMCASLTEITVPASVQSFGSKMFMGCSNLEKAVIKASITELGFNTLYNSVNTSTGQVLTSTSLKEVYLPASLLKIHETALYGNFLEDIYFAGSEEQWNEVYFYKEIKDEQSDEVKEEKLEKSDMIPQNTRIHFNVEY